MILRATTSSAVISSANALYWHSGRRQPQLRAEIKRAMRELSGTRRAYPIANAHYAMAEGARAWCDGARELSVAKLREALPQYERYGAQLIVQPVRLCLAELIGGAEGAQLRERALSEMRAQSIVDPVRFAGCLAPLLAALHDEASRKHH